MCYGRLDVAVDPHADPGPVLVGLVGFNAARIWSSPALRCASLAEQIAAQHEVRVHTDPCLLEMHFGAWEGQSWDNIPRAELDAWAADPWGFTPPGGESAAQVLARVQDFADHLIAAGQDSIIVSHGGPLKLLRALLTHQPPEALAPPPGFGEIIITPS